MDKDLDKKQSDEFNSRSDSSAQMDPLDECVERFLYDVYEDFFIKFKFAKKRESYQSFYSQYSVKHRELSSGVSAFKSLIRYFHKMKEKRHGGLGNGVYISYEKVGIRPCGDRKTESLKGVADRLGAQTVANAIRKELRGRPVCRKSAAIEYLRMLSMSRYLEDAFDGEDLATLSAQNNKRLKQYERCNRYIKALRADSALALPPKWRAEFREMYDRGIDLESVIDKINSTFAVGTRSIYKRLQDKNPYRPGLIERMSILDYD